MERRIWKKDGEGCKNDKYRITTKMPTNKNQTQ